MNKFLLGSVFVAGIACGGSGTGPAKEYPTLTTPTRPATDLVAATVADRSHALDDSVRKATAGAVLYIAPFRSFLLFADERVRAQEIIATWATAEGLQILPPAKTEMMVAQGMAGNDGLTGKACGPTLQRGVAEERWLGQEVAQGKIEVNIWCEEKCTLQVELKLFGRGTEFFAAPYDVSQPWETELPKRLREVRDNGGHDQHGHMNNPVKVKGVIRAKGRDVIADEVAMVAPSAVPGSMSAAVAACKHTVLGMNLLLATEHNVTKCEAVPHARLVQNWDSEVEACTCAAIKSLATAQRVVYRAQGPARRSQGVLTNSGLSISADVIGGDEYRHRGVAWFIPGEENLDVSACFVGRTAVVDPIEESAAVYFGGMGIPTSFNWEFDGKSFTKAELECLTKNLQTARAACPAKQPWVGEARVRLSVTK